LDFYFYYLDRCPENYEGDHCQWPICGIHGRVNVITRTCECYSNFAPPFCQDCLPRFWGEKCSHSLLLSTDARDLDFFPFCRIIFVSFSLFLIYISKKPFLYKV
uniref:EGF-like domain-containing protein n=1 Tax=Dracunculus medinensis TaxID=318479 RepID=A0A0N4U5D1_DRAME